MSILVIESDQPLRESLCALLEADGHAGLLQAGTAVEAFDALAERHQAGEAPDLVLLSSQLPDLGPVECLKAMQKREGACDAPVLMLMGSSVGSEIEAVLRAGAADFVSKPVEGPVLLARVRQALALKAEQDRRREREKELLEVTNRLQEVISSLQGLSSADPQTGLPNRRSFDEGLAREWRRTLRDAHPLSLVLLELDRFDDYGLSCGRALADEALRSVAGALKAGLSRPADLLARLEGARFGILLPGTKAGGASFLAEKLRHAFGQLGLKHDASPTGSLTSAFGVSCVVPKAELRPGFLLAAAEEALFEARRKGGNCVEVNALTED